MAHGRRCRRVGWMVMRRIGRRRKCGDAVVVLLQVMMLLRGDGRVRRRHLDFLDLRFLKTLGFGSSILEPNLDLRFGERERIGEFRSFGDGQILFRVELSLQSQQLLRRERRPRLPVGFMLTKMAGR